MNTQIQNLYPLKIIFILILFFCLVHLHAKDIVVEGFYINLNGDTIRSRFILPLYSVKHLDESQSKIFNDDLYTKYTDELLPNFKKLQWEISMVDHSNNKSKLSPSQCIAYEFVYKKDTLKFISVPNTYSSKNKFLYSYYPDSLFLHIIISGPISLYKYYKTYTRVYRTKEYGYKLTHHKKVRYLLKKEDPAFSHYNRKFFKKNMKKYIADSPSVLTKIEYGKYKVSDIIEIIKDYNGSCMGHNKP